MFENNERKDNSKEFSLSLKFSKQLTELQGEGNAEGGMNI